MPTLPDNEIGHLIVAMSRADSSVANILDGFTNLTNGNPCQFASSSIQNNLLGPYPMFRGPAEQERLILHNLNVQSQPVLKSLNRQQFTGRNLEAVHRPGLQPNSGHPVLSLPFKRKAITEHAQDNRGPHKMKAITEHAQDNRGPQKMSAPNKRVTQVASYATAPIASQVSAPKMSSKANTTSRKVVRIEPITNDSRSNAIKKSVQSHVSPKGQMESHDSVRAKLKESLASALALVFQDQENCSDGKMKIENEAGLGKKEGFKDHKTLESPKDVKSHVSSIPSPSGGCNVDDKTLLSVDPREIFGEASQTESFLGTDSVLPVDDSLFNSGLYIKDDFLQGNGLSWESDLSLHVPKVKETENAVKPEPMFVDLTSDVERKVVQSPESVALAIESELFKLFGGVNKKYKEKGRSLLFNLKDRNNPELRERVMSGDLPPDRLCSMTAEELASKELSQWRIAKAEEFDHMKVLPETDINMRRLVKKTHKGEYLVDFELDGGALEELPVDISIAPTNRSKIDKSDDAPSAKAEVMADFELDGGALEELPVDISIAPTNRSKIDKSDDAPSAKAERSKAHPCEITVLSDGADLQGLMGDGLNDLPPVISLDEFMESLNQDPPFENLPDDSLTTKGELDKENLELSSRRFSPVEARKYHGEKMPMEKMSTEKVEVKKESPRTDGDKNLTGTLKRFDTNFSARLHKCECVWEGQVQLTLSYMANFMALYKSGEKSSCKEWATFFDIKGRVRHVAFDKFLQALPMSRSRAIMVCHFVLKEGFLDSERDSLKELVDSYNADERVGFAEPGNGVELYLCTPRSKTVDMIVNHLPKSYTDRLNEFDDGLIGIVVWRKVQITSSGMSPISSLQQQPVITKPSRAQFVNNETNRNNVFTPKRASPPLIVSNSQHFHENDDAPPGFGPPNQREDDDLPEFQFSGGSRPSISSHPINLRRETGFQHHSRAPSLQVEQMRALIQKYGQNCSNAGSVIRTEPWNDDDDDIPEWQPQPVHNPVLPTHSVHHHPQLVNNQILHQPPWTPAVQPGQPLQPIKPPMGAQHQRAWRLYSQNVGGAPSGQLYGLPGPGYGHLPRDRRSKPYNNRF